MPSTKPTSWPLLKRILVTYIPRHKGMLAVAMVAMLIVAAITTLQAYIVQPLFDSGLIGKRVGVLNTLVLAIFGLTLVKAIAYYFQSYFMEYIGHRIVADMQTDLFARVVHQDLMFFQQNSTGSLVSRFISDLQRLKYSITQIFHAGLRDTAIIIGVVANMFWQDTILTAIALLVIPLAIIPIRKFGKLSRRYSRSNQESIGLLSHILNQLLGHVRQVQSYTMENVEQLRTNGMINDVFVSSIKAARVRALSSPVVEIIGIIVICLLMYYAGNRIADGELTPGTFASFMASILMLTRPLKGLANLFNILQDGLAAAERTFAIMDTPITITNPDSPKGFHFKEGKIQFSKVSLTYPDGTLALNKVDFTIPAGKTVALVGASGAGKSTALNLIPRFFDPTQGKIIIDGTAINEVMLTDLRQYIGLVSQDVAIFDDSARANIAYGNPSASDDDIIQAAKDAAAHEFIAALPNGYGTNLGENGIKLSGGQKQRIAIARALLKNAPILLLDEATSNLDTESERQVQMALEKLMLGRTTLVIAHRLSTIVNADVIHVLENGKIIESGTHTELLAKNGAYANLWHMQSHS